MEHYSDKELSDMFFDGDNGEYVFSLIVAKYSERIYWVVRKIVIGHHDTDDVVQNTFMKAWINIHTFRRDSQLYTWLYRIAVNESLTFLRSRRSGLFSSLSDSTAQMRNMIVSGTDFDGDAAQKKLQLAILKLPPKQRLVFNMRYFEEMPYEQMSQILDTSEGALKSSYHHAVKKIEKYIEED